MLREGRPDWWTIDDVTHQKSLYLHISIKYKHHNHDIGIIALQSSLDGKIVRVGKYNRRKGRHRESYKDSQSTT